MKKIIKNKILALLLITTIGISYSSCSLDEINPGGFTMEISAESLNGYQGIINQCYFAMERRFYGHLDWMGLTEGNTDLWTSQANLSTVNSQWFWFFAGGAPNTTYINDWWNNTYDGIGSCNIAITLAHIPPFSTPEERNAKVAEAHFMRAVYYFNAVEQFGGVTLVLEPARSIDFKPGRTDPWTIYKEVIIPDLEFAFQWLPKGDHSTTTRPTKKSALGFLAKACLQSIQYDDSKSLAADALRYAKMLIDDAESGGATYNTVLYADYNDVFAEENNWENKEALWKHRWYAGPDGSGSSNGNHVTNQNYNFFYCRASNFGARADNILESVTTWGGNLPGRVQPTQHLLNLFVQDDGTLDPRFHASFQTEWKANQAYVWDQGTVDRYDRVSSVAGTRLNVGDLAIKFIMPQDADYVTESAEKLSKPYLVVDYKDVYNNNGKNINMRYTYRNPSASYSGEDVNLFVYFYPSLTKHNSGRWYVVNPNRTDRNGNLNGTFIMRTAEAYLIAAEADLYVNGGANALRYINAIRDRANANPLTGTPNIRMILDERGRELCGEYNRFYDLKRTGMFKDASYLQNTHPDLAVFFKPDYALRPISTTFNAVLEEGGYYQNPGY